PPSLRSSPLIPYTTLFRSDAEAHNDVLPRTSGQWAQFRRDSEERPLQIDRYHDRGHLLIIDRQDVKTRGRRGGRRITLFDRRQRDRKSTRLNSSHVSISYA